MPVAIPESKAASPTPGMTSQSSKERCTLQGINISHLGKRKIIFKMPFFGDMLVPWRVPHLIAPWICLVVERLQVLFKCRMASLDCAMLMGKVDGICCSSKNCKSQDFHLIYYIDDLNFMGKSPKTIKTLPKTIAGWNLSRPSWCFAPSQEFTQPKNGASPGTHDEPLSEISCGCIKGSHVEVQGGRKLVFCLTKSSTKRLRVTY